MENQQESTKIMLTYGIYLGFALIILNLVNYSFGNPYKPHWINNVVTYLLIIGIIGYGIKIQKDQNKGLLKLSDALKIGMGIALVSGIIAVIYYIIFVKFIEPDFASKLMEVQEQVMLERKPDMSEEELEMSLKFMDKFKNLGVTSAVILISRLFSGLIVSLIAGAIMKKEEAYT